MVGNVLRVIVPCALLAGPSVGVSGQEAAPAVRMVADEGEGAKYWPRWRGPSGQGLVSGAGYPDAWSPTQNVRWKTPLSGDGNSSPIVWGDRIFLTTAYDNGRRVSVVAFRRTRRHRSCGRRSRPQGRSSQGSHYKNGHASATPATDGQRVYVSFGARGLVAFDMDGKLVWHRDLGPMEAYHGTAGSPLLYKDRIILYQDQFAGSFIAAFDTRTGKELWRTRRDANVGWGTPIAVRVVDHDEIIVNSQQRVQAYNPDTGAELWRCGGMTLRSDSHARRRVRDGVLLVGPRRPDAGDQARRQGRRDPDATSRGRSPRGSPFVPSPILYGEHLYMVNDMASIVTCLEATTGKVMWQGTTGRRARAKDSRPRRSPSTARCSSPTTKARRSC